jgi:hypothetical protein
MGSMFALLFILLNLNPAMAQDNESVVLNKDGYIAKQCAFLFAETDARRMCQVRELLSVQTEARVNRLMAKIIELEYEVADLTAKSLQVTSPSPSSTQTSCEVIAERLEADRCNDTPRRNADGKVLIRCLTQRIQAVHHNCAE